MHILFVLFLWRTLINHRILFSLSHVTLLIFWLILLILLGVCLDGIFHREPSLTTTSPTPKLCEGPPLCSQKTCMLSLVLLIKLSVNFPITEICSQGINDLCPQVDYEQKLWFTHKAWFTVAKWWMKNEWMTWVCVNAYMSSCSCCNKCYKAKINWVKCKDVTCFI